MGFGLSLERRFETSLCEFGAGVAFMQRLSVHVEPKGPLETARHYVRELIYGANDGIITTFAVVAGVAGGGLSLRVVLIIGAANLFADGLSMAAGNYLSIRSYESVLETQDLPQQEASPSVTQVQRSWRFKGIENVNEQNLSWPARCP